MTGQSGIWAFRTASSPKRGAGHVARCLALAEELPGTARFFLDPDDVFAARIGQAGHASVLEQSRTSADRLLDFANTADCSGVVVDSYDLERDAIARLSGLPAVLKLDDGFGPVYGSVVLNAAVAEDRRFSELPAEARLFGPSYALLPHRFAVRNEAARHAGDAAIPTVARRVLIAMGARDSHNASMLALKACISLGLAGTVAMGRHADHLETVQAYCADRPDWRVEVDHPAIVDLYDSHDLAVGAAGQSLYERMACGLPSLILVLSDNQEGLAAAAEKAGACRIAGAIPDLTPALLADRIRTVIEDRALRASLRRAGLDHVDGQGATRAAKAVAELFDLESIREVSL